MSTGFSLPPINVRPFSVTGVVIALTVVCSAASIFHYAPIWQLACDGRVRVGHLWLLVSCTWPHLGLLHVAFNLMWLAALGPLVEEKLDTVRFALLYLALCLGSSGLAYATEGSGVGLSGVVYGLYAFAWVAARHDADYRRVVTPANTQLLGVWFVICVVTTYTGLFNVGNVAHGAGALVGLALGWTATRRRGTLDTVLAAAALSFAGIAASLWARPYIAWDAGAYRDEWKLAGEAYDRQDYAASVRFYRDAVRMVDRSARWRRGGDPRNDLSKLQYNLALAHEKRGDAAEALHWAELSADNNGDAASWRNVADLRFDAGDDAGAWAALRQAADAGDADAKGVLAERQAATTRGAQDD